jgi:PAS domain S-box-containing protein
MGGISLLSHERLTNNLNYIINEEKKMTRWSNIAELTAEARKNFHEIIINHTQYIVSVMVTLERLNREISELKHFPLQPDEVYRIDEVEKSERKFKSALFAYREEIRDGYTGASAREMERITLKAADEVANIAAMSVRDESKLVQERNKTIFTQTRRTNKLLITGLFVGIFFVVAIVGFMNWALARPIKRLTDSMQRVAEGDFSQRIEIVSQDEVGQLTSNFNRMAEDLERLTAAIKTTQQLLKEVTDGIEEGIMLLSRDFQILWANKKIYELTGLKEGEIIGSHCYRITHHLEEPCKAPYDICPVYEVLKTGKLVSVIHTHFDKKGKEFYAEVTAYPIRDAEGNIIQFVHLVRDVTEKIRAERELEEAYRKLKSTQAQLIQSAKMASVGQLAAGLAHEINNPLTGVLNNAQLIKMQIEQGVDSSILEFKEIIDVIEESALRCKNITKSLLDFSRASKASIQPLSINEAIENVVKLIEHELRLENITIQKELQASLPPVRGNFQLLQEVFMNIIVNARWAIQKKSKTEAGFITIKTQYDAGEGRVNIFISDTGVGIPDEALNKIFDPFFTTKEIGEGTGLGLSVVYGIIKEHQGTIEVESQLGKGTTFKITLPVVK